VIALDTNVLVRFLVEDDAAQAEQARALLQQAVDADSRCYVSDIVMCEIVWVLTTSYKVRRAEISQILGRLLHARNLAFSSSDQLARALESYRAGRGDFADYLIREHGRANGCEAVVTFEGKLLKEPGFMAPSQDIRQ
jgi:predicted nucleic-acid-binding protein